MDEAACCSICLLEYTVKKAHRISSIECGHCFGHDCISRWIKMNPCAACPVCMKPCLLKHVRPMYIGPSVPGTGEDAVLKYIHEAEKNAALMLEIASLQEKLNIMKTRLADIANGKKETKAKVINTKLILSHKQDVIFNPGKSMLCVGSSNTLPALENDSGTGSTDSEVVPCRPGDGPSKGGYAMTFAHGATYGLYMAPFDTNIRNYFLRLPSPVTCLRFAQCKNMRDYCIAASGTEVYMFKITKPTPMPYKWTFENKITAVCDYYLDSCIILVGDSKGKLHSVSTTSCSVHSIPVSKYPVHSIETTIHGVYIATLFDITAVELSINKLPELEVVNTDVIPFEDGTICPYMHSHNSTVLITFRDRDMISTLMLIRPGAKYILHPNISQPIHCRNKICGNKIVMLDGAENVVYTTNGADRTEDAVYTVEANERIIDFSIDDDSYLGIMTNLRIYFYHCRSPT